MPITKLVDTSHLRAGNQNPTLADPAYSEKAALLGGIHVDAIAAFAELWPEVGECFLCGAELAPHQGVTAILPDNPKQAPVISMLARQCDKCGELPYQVNLNRVTKILKRMWPGYHWTGKTWNRKW